MHTLAVLPVKTFPRAKQRLGVALPPGDRRTLAEAMVGDVLDALGRVAGLDGVIVVTAEPIARAAARDAGARVVGDPAEAGQSAAALLGIEAARAERAERVLLVPGDCPALDPRELQALLDGPETPVAIVPDRHRTGTNALLLTPPDAIVPGFGPGSYERHRARAAAGGLAHRTGDVPTLELDVDTPGDLEALRRALADRDPAAAPRTRAALELLATAA